MTLVQQILLGSATLLTCTVLHVALLTVVAPFLAKLALKIEWMRRSLRNICLLCTGILAILAGHTIQLWIWSAAFTIMSVFETFETNFYYATVTYTTLGYGDLVAQVGLRVFATFSSITGLLSFGISTAFLIGLISRVFKPFD